VWKVQQRDREQVMSTLQHKYFTEEKIVSCNNDENIHMMVNAYEAAIIKTSYFRGRGESVSATEVVVVVGRWKRTRMSASPPLHRTVSAAP